MVLPVSFILGHAFERQIVNPTKENLVALFEKIIKGYNLVRIWTDDFVGDNSKNEKTVLVGLVEESKIGIEIKKLPTIERVIFLPDSQDANAGEINEDPVSKI